MVPLGRGILVGYCSSKPHVPVPSTPGTTVLGGTLCPGPLVRVTSQRSKNAFSARVHISVRTSAEIEGSVHGACWACWGANRHARATRAQPAAQKHPFGRPHWLATSTWIHVLDGLWFTSSGRGGRQAWRQFGDVLKGDVMRCREFSSERNAAGWRGLLKGVRRASVARSNRVVNEDIVEDRAPELQSYGRWPRGIGNSSGRCWS